MHSCLSSKKMFLCAFVHFAIVLFTNSLVKSSSMQPESHYVISERDRQFDKGKFYLHEQQLLKHLRGV